MYECPSTEVLEEMGFDFSTPFGMEFEFYCENADREGVAYHLSNTGLDVVSEHYNHSTRSYWKLVTDASLGDDEDEDFDCEYCECTRECDQDCAYNCTPSYNCDECIVNNWDESFGEAPECGECAENNEYPSYDCEDCSQDRWCDECCADHCDRGSGGGSSGMELVSPILVGREGLEQVYEMLNSLEALECRVDSSCGLHVHLDAGGISHASMKNLAALSLLYEPTIDGILPASRRNNCNCKTMCSSRYGQNSGATRLERLVFKFDQVEASRVTHEIISIWNDRYIKVNFEAVHDHGTVEFRQHGGTLNATKTLHWLILCTKMKKRAISRRKVTVGTEPYPSLEDMMDNLKFSSESREFWTERRDQFAEEVREGMKESERAERAEVLRHAQREHDTRVYRQEQLRWYAEFAENPPAIVFDVLRAEPVYWPADSTYPYTAARLLDYTLAPTTLTYGGFAGGYDPSVSTSWQVAI